MTTTNESESFESQYSTLIYKLQTTIDRLKVCGLGPDTVAIACEHRIARYEDGVTIAMIGLFQCLLCPSCKELVDQKLRAQRPGRI